MIFRSCRHRAPTTLSAKCPAGTAPFLSFVYALCADTLHSERGKFEINTKVPGNPIIQDVKNGKLRCVYSPLFYTMLKPDACLPE